MNVKDFLDIYRRSRGIVFYHIYVKYLLYGSSRIVKKLLKKEIVYAISIVSNVFKSLHRLL